MILPAAIAGANVRFESHKHGRAQMLVMGSALESDAGDQRGFGPEGFFVGLRFLVEGTHRRLMFLQIFRHAVEGFLVEAAARVADEAQGVAFVQP